MDTPTQTVVTLDLEGVLIPEVWIAVAEEAGIDGLRRTTRDEPDYANGPSRWRCAIVGGASGLAMTCATRSIPRTSL